MGRAPFTLPGGPTIPIVATLISAGILYGATEAQLITGGYFLAAGAVLYLVALFGARKS